MRLINSIQIDPTKIASYPELEKEIREQLESSTRKFEQLKTTVSNLVEYTRDIRGFIDVDLLEVKAGKYKPNMAVVRSLRLTKYVLATLIYLAKGDRKYLERMKPTEDFFDRRPKLLEIVKTRKDVDTVLLSLYNESPRKFIADHDPLYQIKGLLEEILVTRSGDATLVDTHYFHAYGRQFEESMCVLTGAVLRLLFNVEEIDTDMDIMLYFARSKGGKPVRLKRVFPDDVKRVHTKVDHSLFLLREAANYVLTETEKDPSFIQQVLNQSFAENVLAGCKELTKDLDDLDLHLAKMSNLKTDAMHLCWDLRDRTSQDIRALNEMMDSRAYRDLLLLARDMKEVGGAFFTRVQHLYGYFADLAAQDKVGIHELLERFETSLKTHFSSIDSYLRFVHGLEKKLDSFRKSYGQLTLIEGGRSEFYKTIIHEVSQVCMSLSTSIERGKLFRKHLKSYEEFDLLYDPLYGDKIRNITEPIMRLHETFPAQSTFNLGRFTGRDCQDPDVMRNSYRKIMRIKLCADAILEFYGNLLDDGRYMFDASAVKQESSKVREHLHNIARYCNNAIGEQSAARG